MRQGESKQCSDPEPTLFLIPGSSPQAPLERQHSPQSLFSLRNTFDYVQLCTIEINTKSDILVS